MYWSGFPSLAQFNRLLDELLTRGPAGSAGTVDSLQRSDYSAVGGLLTTGALQHTENAPSTSIRYKLHHFAVY